MTESATAFFQQVGQKVCGYGRLTYSEQALLSVLSDIDFDINEVSGDKLVSAIEVVTRELAFRTQERLVETVHDSAQSREFSAAVRTAAP